MWTDQVLTHQRCFDDLLPLVVVVVVVVTINQGDITDVSIDPENKYIASGSNDNLIRVWSLRDFSPVAVLIGHTNAVTAVAFSPSPFPKNRVLLSTSLDGSARLWWVDEMVQRKVQSPR